MSTETLVPFGVLIEAVERALRAPSVHNTQPWRWRIADGVVELHADRGRHLAGTDPGRRDLVISCGAALHHLLAALAAARVSARVDRLPDSNDAMHLATVHVRSGAPEAGLAELAKAIEYRRSDRRRFSSRPVPETVVAALHAHAAGHGVVLHPVTDPAARRRLEEVLVDAAARQQHTPGYAAELTIWTRRYAGARDGIPLDALPITDAHTPGAGLRPFPSGHLPGTDRADGDASTLLVLTTFDDTVLDHLLTGETTSAVLLAATRYGLATTPLSQGLEVPATRQHVATAVLRTPDHPQLVIRVGWAPANSAELPPTPRRTLSEVVLYA